MQNKRLRTILLAGLFVFASATQAQVHHWKDPESGIKRFSNTAPSWYRSSRAESNAPRVQVFYYNVLVDDTALPYEARLGMRAQTPISRYLPPLLPPSAAQHASR